MNEDTVKKLALIIAANCTRESVLEENLKNGSLAQKDLDAFNKQMSDRLYTFLTYLLNKPADEYSVMMSELSKHFPENWGMPDLDQSFMHVINQPSAQPPTAH
ncbi:hypothetical protein [Endozoicomonas sp. OPT23]|uniref:hypothetical protein n=1 Tax=Endozoicomonas sp. OPT23 TaxID=2072845 RepID=UPI00129A7F89|nr:hypothetical protein [Endozoicomonas sp. OPT23]